MSVTSVVEDWSGRKTSVDKHFRRTAVRRFFVETSIETDNADIIMGAVDPTTSLQVPFICAWHPLFFNCVCLDMAFEANPKSPTQWTVTAQYGPGTGAATQIADPTLRPMTYDWTFNLGQEALFSGNLDTDRMTLLNGASYVGPFDTQYASEVPSSSAGQPVACQTDFTVAGVVCTVNTRNYSPSLANTYINTVNNNIVFGCPLGTALLYSITAQEQFDQNRKLYYTVRFEIHFKETWNTEFIDQGTYQAIIVAGQDHSYQLRPVLDKNGKAYTSGPVLLDGEGAQALVPSAAGYVNPQDVPSPFWRSYQVKAWIDWGPLGLDYQWNLNQQY